MPIEITIRIEETPDNFHVDARAVIKSPGVSDKEVEFSNLLKNAVDSAEKTFTKAHDKDLHLVSEEKKP